MGVLSEIKPEKVFHYFEEISKIPRGSGNMRAISDYIFSEIRSFNLKVRQDGLLNVVAFKPAYPGYEQAPAVMLQGHMDMVCEKMADSTHDFKNDPIKLIVEGQMLHADQTTLGGDDGIAVAYMLAVLSDPGIPHPALECVFTTDEETGMFGAEALDTGDLKASYLINLDNEWEGEFVVSCAGGVRHEGVIPLHPEQKEGMKYELTVTTDKGGHSGALIHKNRPNANVVLLNWLGDLHNERIRFQLIDLNGGLMDNAIPMRSTAHILCDQEVDFLLFQDVFTTEYEESDDTPHLSVKCLGKSREQVFSFDDKCDVLDILNALPNGVVAMTEDIPDLVKTSLNFGILKTDGSRLIAHHSIRSSSEEEKKALLSTVSGAFLKNGRGESHVSGDYPGWAYKKDSRLRELAAGVYERKYTPLSGRKPEVHGIHAGLECGLLLRKMPGLDIISVGPDMMDIHTPKETLSLESAARCYAFLLDVLKEIRN